MDKVRVLDSFNDVTTTPAFAPYTKVVVIVGDNLSYTVGDDTGRTMTVKCPWGTPRTANDLLRQYRGFRYQPFDASGLIIDQAAELGDGIQIGRTVYSGLYEQNISFSSLPKSDVSAPQSEEIDHEFPFKPTIDREYTRQYHETKATLKVQEDSITAEVTARKKADSELSAALQVQAGLISAKVSQTGGAHDGSFTYEMLPTSASWYANGLPILTLDKSGGKFKGDIEAENGFFHGVVRASNIAYGDKDGYFDGAGLAFGSVTNTEIAGRTIRAAEIMNDTITHTEVVANTLGTSVLSSGVNSSLGHANFADAVFNNRDSADHIKCRTLTNTSQYIGVGGHAAQWLTKTIGGVSITYLGR